MHKETKTAADQKLVQRVNRSIALCCIRDFGPISRTDIAKRTGLSKASVSEITTLFIERGLVQEVQEGISSRGPKPILLDLNPNRFYALGIVIGVKYLQLGALNLCGELVISRSSKWSLSRDPEDNISMIIDLVGRLLQEEMDPEKLLGIGVCAPAPIDFRQGTMKSPPNMPEKWNGFPVRTHLEDSLKVPVFLENDANAGALGELWWGAGRDIKNMAYMLVDTGVGGGLIIDGKIYKGTGGTAGEIGHIIVTSNGSPCGCGADGCLEAMVSAPAIVEKVRKKLKIGGQETVLNRFQNKLEELEIDHILEAVEAKDDLAIRIIKTAGHLMGIIIVDIINVTDPGKVVIGGPYVNDILLAAIKGTVRENDTRQIHEETEVVKSKLGKNALTMGAATLVLEDFFLHPGILEEDQNSPRENQVLAVRKR